MAVSNIAFSRRKMLRRWRNSRGKTEKERLQHQWRQKMRENLSLDERIASAFKDGATSDDVSSGMPAPLPRSVPNALASAPPFDRMK
jgi:hypothetical protein